MATINSSNFTINVNRTTTDAELGVNGKAQSTVQVSKGGVLLIGVTKTTPGEGEFYFKISNTVGCTAVKKDEETFYVDTMTSDVAIVEVSINVENKMTYKKIMSITKVKMGEKGTSIVSVEPQYYLSTSKTSQTGGEWTTTPPVWTEGTYIWTRSKITYKDPTSIEYTTPVLDGTWENLQDLQNQIDNNKTEIQTTKETVAEHTTSLNSITSRVSTTETTVTNIQDTIKTTVKNVTKQYYLSTSSTSLTGGSWSSNVPTSIGDKFVWEKIITTYLDDTTSESDPVCLTSEGSEIGYTIILTDETFIVQCDLNGKPL